MKILNSLGLIFFFPFVNLTDRGIISLIIILNGILCHFTRHKEIKGWKYIRNYDILSNIIISIYLLINTKYKIYTILTIIIVLILFIITQFRKTMFFLKALHLFKKSFLRLFLDSLCSCQVFDENRC